MKLKRLPGLTDSPSNCFIGHSFIGSNRCQAPLLGDVIIEDSPIALIQEMKLITQNTVILSHMAKSRQKV